MLIPLAEYKELLESKARKEFWQAYKSEIRESFTSLFNKMSSLNVSSAHPFVEEPIYMEEQFMLSEKEKTLLRFIQDNPNLSKQEIVNKFKTSYSRVTVFKILDKLFKFEIITVSQDPENRQTHHVVFNQKSLLFNLMGETDQLKSAFIRVLTKLKGIIKKNLGDDSRIQTIITFLSDMVQLYKDILDQYIMKMVFDWSKRTSNKNVLTRAYSIAFGSLSSVLAEIASLYQYSSSDATIFETIYADLYEPSPRSYKHREDAIIFARDFKMEQEFGKLLEMVRTGLSSAAKIG